MKESNTFGNPNKGRLTASEAKSMVQPIVLDDVLNAIAENVKLNQGLHIIPPFVIVTQDVIFELIRLGYSCYQVTDAMGIKVWVIDWR